MKGTYPRKELRITPARSHYEQGSIRIFVCVYAPPLPAQWTNGIEFGQAGSAQSCHMRHDHLQQGLGCCRKSKSIDLTLEGESLDA